MATIALAEEEKRLKLHFAAPLKESEKCSGQHLTKEAVAAYFTPREVPVAKTKITATTTTTTFSMESTVMNDKVDAEDMSTAVTEILKDPRHADFHKSRAPAAMLAFAKVVVRLQI